MWRRIIALTMKEFLAVFKEPKSRITIIVPPILQLLVFGYAASFDLLNIPYAVYDEDKSPASREIIAGFHGSANFNETATITRHDQIRPLIDHKDVIFVLHIGPQFSRELSAGQPASVQIIVDGRNSNTALLTLGYVRTVINKFNSSRRSAEPEPDRNWLEKHGGNQSPARLETRAWFNPNLQSRWFMVPGIVGLLTLVVTMLVTSLSVAREREQGTFDQLLVTPLRPVEILIGKTLPSFIIGLTEATFIIAMAVLWFRIPLLGSLLTLYTGVILFLISAIGIGLMISSLAATMQQALLGAFLFVVPAVILSGFTTPIANMPRIVQNITLLNPMRYFMVILRGTFLEGTSFIMLIGQFWPMAVIGMVTLVAAAWLFRHRMY